MTITLLQGEACEMLQTLADRSVQTIVNSPPYYGLRKYTTDPREIGHEPTPAAFVAALVAVYHEARRVLRDDGTLWIVIGDSYANDSKWGGASGAKNSNSVSMPREREYVGLPDKNLIGIPWRLAFALQDDGWYLRQEIIWSKPNCMPESVTDRPTRAHETVFLLSKQARYFYDAAAIAEAGSGNSHGGRLQKEIATPRKINTLQGVQSSTLGGVAADYNAAGARNARSVWNIATQPLSDAHYAPMPEALARRCILAGSAAGDTVLDPFMGSGTVARVAEKLQRNAIGIDLAYQELQAKRTDGVQRELFV